MNVHIRNLLREALPSLLSIEERDHFLEDFLFKTLNNFEHALPHIDKQMDYKPYDDPEFPNATLFTMNDVLKMCQILSSEG